MITSPPRIPIIDVARGVALVAMTIYHFGWDLQMFGWLAPGTATSGAWVVFARCIASSFLALVGVSLVLGHGDGIRWRSFWKRWAMVVAAAALVSLVSYVQVTWTEIDFMFSFWRETGEAAALLDWPAPGRGFIFFGILHAIAVTSLLALPFLRAPWWMTALAAVAVLAVWQMVALPAFSEPWLLWTGLGDRPPVSNDYVPVVPWLAAVLAGVAMARLVGRLGWWPRLATVRAPAERPLAFIGRHSLVYYLVHQPVLIGTLWLFTTFVAQPDTTETFIGQCERQCSAARDASFCERYCGCVTEGLKIDGTFSAVSRNDIDEQVQASLRETVAMCSAE